MTNSPYSLLHLKKTAWQLCGEETAPIHNDSSAEELIEQVPLIVKALAEAKGLGKPIVLGLDVDWCLAATIDISSPQMLRKPQLLHYQLEEWIPWSAEEYVCDFIGHRSQAFLVAVRHQELAAFLQALEAEGVLIAAIVPTTLLAAVEHLLVAEKLPAEHVLLWQHENSVDLLAFRDEKLLSWSHLPADSAEIARQVQLSQLQQKTAGEFYSRGLSEELAGITELPTIDQIEAATITSQAILAGQQEPLLNLRQGELAGLHRHQALGKELSRLKMAAVFLLLGLGVWFWVRSEQYQEATAGVQTQLAEGYQDLFPDAKKTPQRIGIEIAKEHRLLSGTRAPTSDLPSPVAADAILEKLLQHLPDKMRFRLPEIRIEKNRLTLGGEVRSNTDADRIAAALRANGFTVEPPRTQRLSGKGFGVRLQGKVEENPDE